MKNQNIFNFSAVLAVALFVLLGCNAGTANMSSFKTSTDKEGKTETTTFKDGDTLYANAIVSNNPGKVKVKLSLVDSKGATVPGSEVSIDLDGSGTANYHVAVSEALPAGSYKVNADMINEAGEKKDSKSVNVTIAE
jgi:hypothetical protein